MDTALANLEGLEQERELSIIKLSEPILAPDKNVEKRGSDVSASSNAIGNPTPASLKAELTHYQELFTKLRFSYVEQVTKEKFLRAVVGDPPLFVTSEGNTALEVQLLELKAALKSRKLEVADIISDLERRGRELSQRYQGIKLQKEQLQTLPTEIENMEAAISSLKSSQGSGADGRPELCLSLPKTSELLTRREAELENLNQELEMLKSKATKKTMELDRLQEELKPLETQKENVLLAAEKARRLREQGINSGSADDLEAKGRWLRGVEATMRHILEAES